MKKINLPKGCSLRRLAVALSPGPFVNAKLLSVGCDEKGIERFWISTFNETSGTVGILADETGRTKPFHFKSENACFYSAAVEDARTLWLCGDLSNVVRLNLDSGQYETFPTGARTAQTENISVYTHLLHSGMAYDKTTRRLFAAARLPEGRTGFSFDIRNKKSVIHRNEWESLYHYNSFPNGDGTWTIAFHYPAALLRWNPQTQTVQPSKVSITGLPLEWMHHFVHDPRHGFYIPTLGWYDAKNDELIKDGPRPEREMLWSTALADRIFGYKVNGGDAIVSAWDTRNGSVTDLLQLSNTPLKNIALSQRGNLVSMTLDGEFRVHDGKDLGLKLSRRSPSESVGYTLCVRLLDRQRIMGTTFITQRFWQGDLAKKQSWDCGRAASGVGQITKIARVGKRVYMMAYTSGELVEYDPDQTAAFPVNPRTVTQHPLAMRPVAYATDGKILWYSCSRHYGIHGSVLFRYDTRSGQATWSINPLGERQIFSMFFDPRTNELICGSTIHCDQAFAKPVETKGMLARIGADDLVLRDSTLASDLRVEIIGWYKQGQLLCIDCSDEKKMARVVRSDTLADLDVKLPPVLGESESNTPWPIEYAGKFGWFLMNIHGQLQLHDLCKRQSLVRVILQLLENDRWHVDGDHVLITRGREVLMIHNALKR